MSTFIFLLPCQKFKLPVPSSCCTFLLFLSMLRVSAAGVRWRGQPQLIARPWQHPLMYCTHTHTYTLFQVQGDAQRGVRQPDWLAKLGALVVVNGAYDPVWFTALQSGFYPECSKPPHCGSSLFSYMFIHQFFTFYCISVYLFVGHNSHCWGGGGSNYICLAIWTAAVAVSDCNNRQQKGENDLRTLS